MSDHEYLAAVTPMALRQRRTPPTPGYREITVAGRIYRVVQDPAGPNGFRWFTAVGQTAFGEPDWREVTPPARRDVDAALFAAS
jgi:hypothetical protein